MTDCPVRKSQQVTLTRFALLQFLLLDGHWGHKLEQYLDYDKRTIDSYCDSAYGVGWMRRDDPH